MNVTLTGGQPEANVSIRIIDDTVPEDAETFKANLRIVHSNVRAKIKMDQSQANITIEGGLLLDFNGAHSNNITNFITSSLFHFLSLIPPLSLYIYVSTQNFSVKNQLHVGMELDKVRKQGRNEKMPHNTER